MISGISPIISSLNPLVGKIPIILTSIYMKITRLACLILLAPSPLIAQTLIEGPSFYDPDFKVRRPGATSGLLNLNVNNTSVSGNQTSGNSSWTHSAGGLAQVRANLTVLSVPVANADVQLAAYTETTGDSLVFGRELSTEVTLLGGSTGGLNTFVDGLVNDVVGASVLYNWKSDASISGLAIAPNQLYQVNFNVTSGNGLPVNVLDSSTFGITTAGVTGASNESAQLLDLLGLLSIGSNSSTGQFSFNFKSATALESLDFSFAATTGVGVSALGGQAENQNVLTFSGFEVVQIPEPSALLMLSLSLGGICFLRRRRL